MQQNSSIKVRFADQYYDAFIFPRIYDALITELQREFDKKNNLRIMVDNEVFTKVDVRVCNFLLHSFGEIMYYFPDTVNPLVNAAKKMRQEKMMFSHVIEYFSMFKDMGYDQKFLWYQNNTPRDKHYRKEIERLEWKLDTANNQLKLKDEEIAALVDSVSSLQETDYSDIVSSLNIKIETMEKELLLRDDIINKLEKQTEMLKSEISTHKLSCPAEDFKKFMPVYTAKITQVDSLESELMRVKEKLKEQKEHFEYEMNQKDRQLNDVQVSYDEIDKLNVEINALNEDLNKLYKENKKLKEKIRKLRQEKEKENRKEEECINKGFQDGSAMFYEISVNVKGLFSLWNFEYNRIIRKVNHLIKMNILSFEDCKKKIINVFESTQNSYEQLKQLSKLFGVEISSLFGQKM